MHFKYIAILLVKLYLNKTEKKFHILVLKTEYLDYTYWSCGSSFPSGYPKHKKKK